MSEYEYKKATSAYEEELLLKKASYTGKYHNLSHLLKTLDKKEEEKQKKAEEKQAMRYIKGKTLEDKALEKQASEKKRLEAQTNREQTYTNWGAWQ